MQILNEVLYYKGVEGIYVYSGGQPSLISYRLGLGIYSDATSGSDGRKYYVSMKNMEDKWALFVYDTVVGEWVEEGEEELKDATFIEGRLFLCIGNSVYIADDPASEELVAWEATLPYIEANTLDHKRFRKLRIRGENGSNSVLYVHISAEGIEGEKTVATINTAGRWTKTIPLPAMRTDVLKVRFSGTGEVLVRDMAIEYVLGSDLE